MSQKYPNLVYHIEKYLRSLLKYYEYPEPIRRSILSTNIIKRINKKIYGRIRIIYSPSSEETVIKIIYLGAAELNEKWSFRSMRGFYKC